MELMKDILIQNQNFRPPKIGELIEGKVIAKKSTAIYLDLGVFGTGVIYGKEFKQAKGELKKINIGEKIVGKIVELENEEGYVELSVAGASKEIALELLRKKKETGEKIKVQILGANKGGLLTKISGIPAFLPVSQLAQENYPKVEDGNLEKILEELKKFSGKEIEVKILGILEDGQVILSEKLAKLEKLDELEKYEIGKVIEGEVAGITDYGIFLKFDQGQEGLIPIEEVHPQNLSFQIGQKVKAKICSISDKKILLTLKI